MSATSYWHDDIIFYLFFTMHTSLQCLTLGIDRQHNARHQEALHGLCPKNSLYTHKFMWVTKTEMIWCDHMMCASKVNPLSKPSRTTHCRWGSHVVMAHFLWEDSGMPLFQSIAPKNGTSRFTLRVDVSINLNPEPCQSPNPRSSSLKLGHFRLQFSDLLWTRKTSRLLYSNDHASQISHQASSADCGLRFDGPRPE